VAVSNIASYARIIEGSRLFPILISIELAGSDKWLCGNVDPEADIYDSFPASELLPFVHVDLLIIAWRDDRKSRLLSVWHEMV